MRSVLFVCLGNICRSPIAQGVFRKLVSEANRSNQITIDPAGTGNWNVGHPPDLCAIAAVFKHGVDISNLKATQVSTADLARYHYIIAMDKHNEQSLMNLADRCDVNRKKYIYS